MAEPTKKAYSRDITGRPVQTSDEELAAQLAELGQKPIGEEEAKSSAQAQKNLDYVDQNWGAAGKLGMGALSGLTLGAGPGLMAQQGFLDPGHLQAAQTSPLYTGGDIAGMTLPALLSGGESLGARGLSWTPAGVMGRLGSASERLAGSVLGDSAGVLGSLASKPLQMAARGATEGALINMGHTVGDNLMVNKPLSAQALAASGADGALFGGLIGGTLGTVAGLGSAAIDASESVAKRAMAGGKGNGLVAKAMGVPAMDASEETLLGYGEGLKKGGSSVGDTTTGQAKGAKNWLEIDTKARNEVIQDLTKNAPDSVPNMARLEGNSSGLGGRINAEVIGPRVGTAGEAKARQVVDSFWDDFKNVGVQKELTKPVHAADAKGGYTIMGVTEGAPTTWEKLIKSRDQLAATIDTSVKPNPLLADTNTIKREILNSLDSEIRAAMEGSGVEGAAEKYAGATQQMKLAQELEGHLGKKAAAELMATHPGVTSNDLAYAGVGAMMGHPMMAAVGLGTKAVARAGKAAMEPWLAQMAYDTGIGAKAMGAEQAVRGKVLKSVGAFFKGATKAPAYGLQSREASKGRDNSSSPRKAYEEAATRLEQLMSGSHQEKVRKYSEHLADQGYEDLAREMMAVNQRAVQYASWNKPASQGAKVMTSLKKLPVSKSLTEAEHKAERMAKGVTNPTALLEDLESGKLSGDGVRAAAYVYPEIWGPGGLVAQESAQQILSMKQEGKFMPMDKIMTLSLALNTPLDSTLEPSYVAAVQMALNAPAQNQPNPSSMASSGGGTATPPGSPGATMTSMGQSLLTPLQNSMS